MKWLEDAIRSGAIKPRTIVPHPPLRFTSHVVRTYPDAR